MTSTDQIRHSSIERYFELAPGADVEPYFAQFAPDAVVEDENETHQGLPAIRAWRSKVPAVDYRVAEVVATGAQQIARVNISGDFPGSPVRLTFTFRFTTNGRIAALTIRP